ncbi:SKP1-like 21 [Actinidia rufa]|uniref:SKP1-like 21 n=1 Tax=Actinidia rufa TaxID=165716 RepID=A0A7J0ECE7_9ERIC|nr:SKP1-like 21 [Actinidia rufa]
MSEGTMAIVKPEKFFNKQAWDLPKNYALSLPQQVNPAIFGLILDYCRFHQVPGRSNKERKIFDEKFVHLDTNKLCELASAADSLQLRPLVDLTSRALARMIEGRTPEEVREIFNIPDDLTEEEKLEPLRNITDDPHIRLLNRLYARKRKELREREQLKNVEVKEERADERSVDDLLSFINGEDGDSKGVKTSKKKRRTGREKINHGILQTMRMETIRRLPLRFSIVLPTYACPFLYYDKFNGISIPLQNDAVDNVATPNRSSKLQDSASITFLPKFEFEDDDDIDDELDPALKEEIDREVEDFARRLNSAWPERMQERVSLGHERLVPMSVYGSSSLKRYTGML